MSTKIYTEQYNHDVCNECGSLSMPAEGVPDQSLRACTNCGNEWFEDLYRPVFTKEDYARTQRPYLNRS